MKLALKRKIASHISKNKIYRARYNNHIERTKEKRVRDIIKHLNVNRIKRNLEYYERKNL